MELTKARPHFIPIGLAIFSMFFGAGNSIFPLLVGTQSSHLNSVAMGGLVITAILIPMLGLYAMILYKGDYKAFFYRLGKVPGFFLISLIMIMIGPFAGIPRCITLAFGTLKPHLGTTPLVIFSFCTCFVVFFKTVKKSRLIDILGKVLTPLLLICLSIVMIKGLFMTKAMQSIHQSPVNIFLNGLTTGYQMMDLLAGFFFATTVLTCLKMDNTGYEVDHRSPIITKSILLAASLLALVYLGFSYVGAFQSAHFQGVSKNTLLGAIGVHVLGPQLGIIMGIAFALACLTTIITLVSVFADFLYEECFNKKVPHVACLILTLLSAFFFSNLGFDGICQMVGPLLNVCYPALICLTLLNILHKLYGVKWMKLPVLLVFGGSLLFNLI